jgi:transcriptional regulator with XRE-family HTH domain
MDAVAIYRQLLLCSRIRTLRVEACYTQVDVAERLEISQAAYSRLEKGEVEISVTKLLELCAIYGVEPAKLLMGL